MMSHVVQFGTCWARFAISLAFIFAFSLRSAWAVVIPLTTAERMQFESKAAEGDATAAWQLYLYHGPEDPITSDARLRRAAELDHAPAQRTLAYHIKELAAPAKDFGTNAPDAVKNLLLRSARTEGNACYELASAFAQGYFGTVAQTNARVYFEQGARLNYRLCWQKLSHYYHHGIGGPTNVTEAYYWISLEAQCVDPRSIGGKDTWSKREQLVALLSLAQLEQEWKRVDDFMVQVTAKKVTVNSAPFLSGMIDPKLEAEGRQLAKQNEAEHRKKWQSEKSTSATPTAERTKEVLLQEDGMERHWVIKSGGLIFEEHYLTARGNLHVAIEYTNGIRSLQADSLKTNENVRSTIRMFWQNGKPLSTTSRIGAEPHGAEVVWWPNGKTAREAHFEAGRPLDTWKFYDESGGLVGEGTFKYGRRQDGIFLGNDGAGIDYFKGFPMKKQRIENGVMKEEVDFLVELKMP